MREIKLGKSGLVALVDDEDYDFLSSMPWSARRHKRVTYAGSCRYVDGKYVEISMHRLICKCPAGMFVDHIDGDGLNNQKSNLRICTHQQNNMHRSPSCALGYLGVSFYQNRYRHPYRASICHDGKSYHLGAFSTPEEAALAYNKAAIKLHGEYATINIISH